MRWIRLVIAWVFALIAAAFLWTTAQVFWQIAHPLFEYQRSLASELTLPAIMALFPLVFGLAWWMTIRNHSSARGWGITAGCILAGLGIIPMHRDYSRGYASTFDLIFQSALILIGVTATLIYAFAKSESHAAIKVKRQSLPGDGTSAFLNHFVGIAATVAGFGIFNQWDKWAQLHDLSSRDLIHSLPQLALVIFLVMTVHEAGHVVVALCLDMKLIRVIFGPIEFARDEDGRWKVSYMWSGLKGIFLGAIQVVPNSVTDFRRRKILQVAAGPAASIAAALLAGAIVLSSPGSPWQDFWESLANFSGISLLVGLFNLVPFAIGNGAYSDGAKLYQLIKGGAWAEFQRLEAMIYAMSHTPIRPREMNPEAIENVATHISSNLAEAYSHLLAYSYYFDLGMMDKSGQAISKAAQLCDEKESEVPDAWISALVFGTALLCRDVRAARAWWDKLASRKTFKLENRYWTTYAAVLWQKGKFAEAWENLERGETWANNLPDSGNAIAERNAARLLRTTIEQSQHETTHTSLAESLATDR